MTLAHKLAIEWGCTSPMELLESMTSSEITSWHAWNAMSPIGGERMDYLAAGIMATVVNSEPMIKKKVTLQEMLLKWRDDPESKQQKIKRLWSHIVKTFNARSGKHG